MRKILQTFRAFQVKFFSLFYRNYVKNKLKKRKGKCRKCGACCKSCKYLNKKTKLCKIYKERPSLGCYKEFPIDNLDKKIWNVKKTCGYTFSN